MIPRWAGGSVALAGLVLAAAPVAGQAPGDAQGIRSDRPRRGSQFLIPLGSFLLPGLGQHIHGATVPGLGFTAAAAGGYALYGINEGPAFGTDDELPRTAEAQLAYEGQHVAVTAGALSAYDAFRRAVPALQREDKYRFLTADENVGAVLSAPLDFRFLGRWTTWLDLGYTAVVTAVVLGTRDAGQSYEPFRARDAAFVTALSLNAGVGEEALFRGWLLPLMYQNFGRHFWLANAMQAGLFGTGHVPRSGEYALVIAGWALYEGWLVRRNGWSIRESVFHHFWSDVLLGTAALLTDERATVQVRLPAIRF